LGRRLIVAPVVRLQNRRFAEPSHTNIEGKADERIKLVLVWLAGACCKYAFLVLHNLTLQPVTGICKRHLVAHLHATDEANADGDNPDNIPISLTTEAFKFYQQLNAAIACLHV
jgi:hypothetical protein